MIVRSHSEGEIITKNANNQSDKEEKSFFYKWISEPHSLIALMIGSVFIVHASHALGSTEADINDDNIKKGIFAAMAVFLGYCLFQAPGTILIRPHPSIWKIVHGIAVLYLVFLTFLLFQSKDHARLFLRHLHPDLGVDLGERSYGADCRIYTPENEKNKFKNVYDTIFDEFVIAHALGWFGKAIMFRNQLLLWILSIGFELMEVTFNHMLPNFNECWWDSIILDVLICNWLGIWIGMITVRYFDGKFYDWIELNKKNRKQTLLEQLKRGLIHFTPATFDADEWNMFSGPKRFIQVFGLIILTLVVELNAFFLKSCLWIPPTNYLNSLRLLIWWLIANPAIREYNHYLQSNERGQKLGSFCWLSVAICIVEVLISVKFGKGAYPKSMPAWIFWSWALFFGGIALFLVGWSVKNYAISKHFSKMETNKKSN